MTIKEFHLLRRGDVIEWTKSESPGVDQQWRVRHKARLNAETECMMILINNIYAPHIRSELTAKNIHEYELLPYLKQKYSKWM